MSCDGWKEVRLGDFCSKIGSGVTPRGGDNVYIDEGVSLIRSQNIYDFSFDYNGLVYIDNEQAEKMKNVEIEKLDVLLNITGDSVARCCLVPDDILPARVNQHVSIIRPNQGLLNSAFLQYELINPNVKEYLLSLASTGGTRKALTKNMIENLKINIPPIKEQRAIAATLSALDDKIELNNRINKKLEEMAQAIFKSWFVDFEPFQDGVFEESELGRIPKGWKVYKLEELIESVSITHKLNCEKVIFLNTSDIEEGRVLHHNYSLINGLPGQAKKSIQKNDILFTEIRPANKRYALIDFDAQDYVVSTKLMVLRTKKHVQPIVIYNFLTSNEILAQLQHIAESRSGTFPQITFDQVKELKLALPQGDFLQKYTDLAWSIFKQITFNNKQTRTIINVRDSLLPKLMSGEIRVPIDNVTQEVV